MGAMGLLLDLPVDIQLADLVLRNAALERCSS